MMGDRDWWTAEAGPKLIPRVAKNVFRGVFRCMGERCTTPLLAPGLFSIELRLISQLTQTVVCLCY